ncbi:FAD:protein FMN transferase [Ramlibacter alkalitolerans]|uniref:FAD:protein FMN transferase n=1 Tax=Ramlibacter alkalitolerans TaxID=2039631 RepID=A0ABS1JJ14_9BURK|nr:FAD:protein FMN transferase [Ramlibacter alkalitolerans]MBL0424217.1 FAD:protein FMN transferase [Ramlibacter alkalitolerans]
MHPLPLRRRTLLQGLGAATVLSACGGASIVSSVPSARFEGFSMGSAWRVSLAGRQLTEALRRTAEDAVAAALAAVDSAMSTHKPQSELSRFNAHAGTTPFALSRDTLQVFALAQQASAATQGAFDVTVAPAVDAWGFGPARTPRLPGDSERRALERNVGWHLLQVDADSGTVAKQRAQVRADLSGIAKGYAVDRAAQALEALGIAHYLVDAGGEVRTRGLNARGTPWQIAIEQPEAGARRPRYVLPLSGLAVATSGDYRNFFERDGQRYSHEIDPATGRPIANRLTSVSVAASRGAWADALGKLIVLGPERGYALAVEQRIAAYFIVREADGRLHDFMTPAFAALGGRPYRA